MRFRPADEEESGSLALLAATVAGMWWNALAEGLFERPGKIKTGTPRGRDGDAGG